jgi:hypothetical protein
MISNVKTLWLALVAVLAMSAVIVPTAQAEATTHKITSQTNSYPLKLSATSAFGNEIFKTEGGKVECKGSYSASVGAASSSVTAHPTYTECKAFGFFGEAKVVTTGCDYKFNLTTRLAVDKYQAHDDLVCSAGNKITIESGTCEVWVHGQTGLTHVGIENMTQSPHNDLTIDATIGAAVGGAGSITYTVTKDGFGCPFVTTLPLPNTKTGGTFETVNPVTVTAANDGVHIG